MLIGLKLLLLEFNFTLSQVSEALNTCGYLLGLMKGLFHVYTFSPVGNKYINRINELLTDNDMERIDCGFMLNQQVVFMMHINN